MQPTIKALSCSLVALIATAAMASCGGDDPSAESKRPYDIVASTTMTVATPRLTKPEFIRRMSKICGAAWVKAARYWRMYRHTQEPTLSERERFEDAVRVTLLASLDFYIFDNFRIIGGPAGSTDELERVIAPFQEAVELGQMNRWRAHTTAEVARQFRTFNRRAARYGLADCLVNESHLKLQS
jgi:hypothetical protein